jgi:hypothetical protein
MSALNSNIKRTSMWLVLLEILSLPPDSSEKPAKIEGWPISSNRLRTEALPEAQKDPQ